MTANAALRSWWAGRNLIGKFAAILLVCVLVFVPLTYAALELLLAPTFATIEDKAVEDQSRRAQHSLAVFEQNLANNISDYAVWDNSYNYIKTGNPAFETETLTPLAYQNMGIDVSGYVAADGKDSLVAAVDRQRVVPLPDETRFFAGYFAKGPLFAAASTQEKSSDYVRTARGLFLIKTEQSMRSDGSGPRAGFIAMGLLLDAKTLSEALQVKVALDIDLTTAERAELAASPSHTLNTTLSGQRRTRMGLVDSHGQVIASVDFAVPRSVTSAGQRAILLAALGMTAAMLLLIVVVSLSIRAIAVRRLQRLEQQVSKMRQSDFELPADLLAGHDEICQLARQFAGLDEDLDQAEDELRRASYLQGKADSAAGMLHNVRNSLAPLRVIQERWLHDESQDFRLNLERAIDELESPDCPSERRDALRDYVQTAAREIAKGAPGRRAEMAEAKSTIDQIAEILGTYDFDTSGSRPGDIIDPLKVIQQELKLLCAERFPGLAVALPEHIPQVVGNRVQLGQVLGNLLVNAAEAVAASAAEKPAITVTHDEPGDGKVTIRIADNGDGIAPDKLAKVFERGYTTRDHKSGGLGMHWSSIAIQSMGGTLAIASDGPGHGALVTITLPAFQTPAAMAA